MSKNDTDLKIFFGYVKQHKFYVMGAVALLAGSVILLTKKDVTRREILVWRQHRRRLGVLQFIEQGDVLEMISQIVEDKLKLKGDEVVLAKSGIVGLRAFVEGLVIELKNEIARGDKVVGEGFGARLSAFRQFLEDKVG